MGELKNLEVCKGHQRSHAEIMDERPEGQCCIRPFYFVRRPAPDHLHRTVVNSLSSQAM